MSSTRKNFPWTNSHYVAGDLRAGMQKLSAYRDIWKDLVEVKKTVLSLRSIFDSHRTDQTEEQRMQQRLGRFAESYKQFLGTVEGTRPFYPEQVWNELDALATMLRDEAINYEYKERDFLEYWKGAQASAEAIVKQIHVVSEAIRTRIASLSVV